MVPSSHRAHAPSASRRSGAGAVTRLIVEEHEALAALALRLRMLADALAHGTAPGGDEPASLLDEFESEMLVHFASEESEEFYGSIVSAVPGLEAKVARMRREHVDLASALDELVEYAIGKPPVAALAERLTRFLDWFDAHEEAEERLLGEFVALARQATA